MKTPLQEFYEYMEQRQYFIGNDLYVKYHELRTKEMVKNINEPSNCAKHHEQEENYD